MRAAARERAKATQATQPAEATSLASKPKGKRRGPTVSHREAAAKLAPFTQDVSSMSRLEAASALVAAAAEWDGMPPIAYSHTLRACAIAAALGFPAQPLKIQVLQGSHLKKADCPICQVKATVAAMKYHMQTLVCIGKVAQCLGIDPGQVLADLTADPPRLPADFEPRIFSVPQLVRAEYNAALARKGQPPLDDSDPVPNQCPMCKKVLTIAITQAQHMHACKATQLGRSSARSSRSSRRHQQVAGIEADDLPHGLARYHGPQSTLPTRINAARCSQWKLESSVDTVLPGVDMWRAGAGRSAGLAEAKEALGAYGIAVCNTAHALKDHTSAWIGIAGGAVASVDVMPVGQLDVWILAAVRAPADGPPVLGHMQSVGSGGHLQVWRATLLRKSSSELECAGMSLAYRVIGDWGACSSIEWCPAAAPKSDAAAQESGLGLALGVCSDGAVRAWALPHPDTICAGSASAGPELGAPALWIQPYAVAVPPACHSAGISAACWGLGGDTIWGGSLAGCIYRWALPAPSDSVTAPLRWDDALAELHASAEEPSSAGSPKWLTPRACILPRDAAYTGGASVEAVWKMAAIPGYPNRVVAMHPGGHSVWCTDTNSYVALCECWRARSRTGRAKLWLC